MPVGRSIVSGVALALLAGCGAGDTLVVPVHRVQVLTGDGTLKPLCVPISVSSARDYPSQRLAVRDAMVKTASEMAEPLGIQLDRGFDSVTGVLLWMLWDAPGTVNDFRKDLTWNERLQVVEWSDVYSAGAPRSALEVFRYDPNGRIYGWERNAPGAWQDGAKESYAFDERGRLTRVILDRAGTEADHTYSLSWTEQGKILKWSEEVQGAADYLSEDFLYDERGLMTRWTRSIPGVIQERVDVVYDNEGDPLIITPSGTWGEVLVKNCW